MNKSTSLEKEAESKNATLGEKTLYEVQRSPSWSYKQQELPWKRDSILARLYIGEEGTTPRQLLCVSILASCDGHSWL